MSFFSVRLLLADFLYEGSDTGSTALNATLFYLSRSPLALCKVQTELSQTFDSISDISPQSVRDCIYLCACLDESMRLSPPIPAALPRIVDHGGTKVAGEYITEGVVVSVPNFTTFRDERYFSRPHHFKPERWIVGSQPEYTGSTVKSAREAFHPFSLGPRQCIGKRLALREVSYILAKLIYTFEIESVGDSGELRSSAYAKMPRIEKQPILDQFDSIISIESGPILRFKTKKDVKLS